MQSFNDSGIGWTSLPTRSPLCPLWRHLNDVALKKSFLQQTTRDSKRRASKEAGALSKDGQPVTINSSGDAEPGNVCDER